MMKLFLFLCLTLCVVGHAMHIHPKHEVDLEEQENNHAKKLEKFTAEVDVIPVDVIQNIHPSRFVPINSLIFFNSYPPCQQGFVRDVIGVCREVWD